MDLTGWFFRVTAGWRQAAKTTPPVTDVPAPSGDAVVEQPSTPPATDPSPIVEALAVKRAALKPAAAADGWAPHHHLSGPALDFLIYLDRLVNDTVREGIEDGVSPPDDWLEEPMHMAIRLFPAEAVRIRGFFKGLKIIVQRQHIREKRTMKPDWLEALLQVTERDRPDLSGTEPAVGGVRQYYLIRLQDMISRIFDEPKELPSTGWLDEWISRAVSLFGVEREKEIRAYFANLDQLVRVAIQTHEGIPHAWIEWIEPLEVIAGLLSDDDSGSADA